MIETQSVYVSRSSSYESSLVRWNGPRVATILSLVAVSFRSPLKHCGIRENMLVGIYMEWSLADIKIEDKNPFFAHRSIQYSFSRMFYFQFSNGISSGPLSNQPSHSPLPRRPCISTVKLYFLQTKWKPHDLIKALPAEMNFPSWLSSSDTHKEDLDNSLFSATANVLSQPICEAGLGLSSFIS